VEKVFTLIYARDEEPAARIKIFLTQDRTQHRVKTKRRG